MWRAAKAVPARLGGPPGGEIFAELYPVGKWTRERLATRALTAEVRDLTARLRKVRDERNTYEARILRLVGALDEAKRVIDNIDECDEKAARADLIDEVRIWAGGLRP